MATSLLPCPFCGGFHAHNVRIRLDSTVFLHDPASAVTASWVHYGTSRADLLQFCHAIQSQVVLMISYFQVS